MFFFLERAPVQRNGFPCLSAIQLTMGRAYREKECPQCGTLFTADEWEKSSVQGLGLANGVTEYRCPTDDCSGSCSLVWGN